mmetsp:Transcript_42189/g.70410  ORF Transcript_42189/g.70410 Transcript_42189/m.70410 type:complete len:294 (-) Transcript_42189:312-1193(-)|eukprot:CAMPEP_0198209470 /NCGR_PEP_ID=MMETSP1445-20131203/16138_1 /TAXON_ID=36898 /ORGANISM="Pyramimonas sp., Strain CCMP2087" /LENGTH=293 /DNA_ID=CAMNT_0043883255 /DNA_START=86 /DNA_END=967 /DNA_ORIENTATION=-
MESLAFTQLSTATVVGHSHCQLRQPKISHKGASLSSGRSVRGCVSLSTNLRKNSKRLVVNATATEGAARPRPGEKKGFVEEMRFVAMKLHTREQAPKEGEAKAAPEMSMQQMQPTREGYLKYLVESQVLYGAMEKIMKEAKVDSYKVFQNTGLERVDALSKDIAWFKSKYDLDPPVLKEDGSGTAYATLLTDLSVSNPPAFICHFYNVYFAHTAGGRMIGRKMSEMLLDSEELAFYQYESDLKELMEKVKENLNTVAEGWTTEEKEFCLKETAASFQYSGKVMRAIFTALPEH